MLLPSDQHSLPQQRIIHLKTFTVPGVTNLTQSKYSISVLGFSERTNEKQINSNSNAVNEDCVVKAKYLRTTDQLQVETQAFLDY